ncbi:MAG: hypothetical protein M3Y65_13290 [Pseudomonadota bacterium]|nr:hypothetical protein [Pseudomonadota bacterium]
MSTRPSEALLAIARESVWNVFVHAQPSHVTATLDYSAGGVGLTVTRRWLRHPGRGTGLPGLRERAANTGATWTLALSREHATTST